MRVKNEESFPKSTEAGIKSLISKLNSWDMFARLILEIVALLIISEFLPNKTLYINYEPTIAFIQLI